MKKMIVLLLTLLSFSSLALAQSEVKLDPAARKQLNTYFSNFSEAYVESFQQGAVSDEALLAFAKRHNYINNFKLLKRSPDGQHVLLPSAMVDRSTERYFGRKIAKHAQAAYPILLADGEAYVFSQVDRLTDIGNGQYRAEGSIYSTGSGETLDPHGTPDQWKKAGAEVERLFRFTALIQKAKTGQGRYILLEYQVMK